MTITITILWQDDSGANVPLTRTFFKYRDANNIFSPEWTGQTDDSGLATLDEVTPSAAITLFAENPVIRMMSPGLIPLSAINAQLTRTVSDGAVLLVPNDSTPENEPFRIAMHVQDIYDRSVRLFSPFGFNGPLNTQLADPTKIEGIFPGTHPRLDRSLSYTEPAGTYTQYPIIHFLPKVPPTSPLFSRSTIAHEFGHALHWSQVPYWQRVQGETQYLAWLAETLGGTHNFSVPTTPFVAWIEVFGWFVELYDAILIANPTLTDVQRRLQLFSLTAHPATATPLSTTVRGDGVEGALFRALFQDYASKPGIGLDFVVRTFLQSQSLEFSQYAEWIRMEHGRFSVQYTALREAASRWGLTPLRSGSVRDVARDCAGLSGSFSIRDQILTPDQKNSSSPVSVTMRLSDIDRDCA